MALGSESGTGWELATAMESDSALELATATGSALELAMV
jgi:hypothetical protein